MQLHRSEQAADWLSVAPSDRNVWQRVAARTHSVVTPGNVISVVGFGLAIVGFLVLSNEHYWLSLGLLFSGRLLDLADGFVADKTATKCRLGEWLDATSDKVLTVVALVLLPANGVILWWAALSLLAAHVLIAALIVLSNFIWRRRTHSSAWGKYSMAATWTCLPLFILAAALPGIAAITVLAFAALIAALVLALIALVDYGCQYTKSATT